MQAHMWTQELQTLWDKGTIEHVPLPDRESGYYSQYFLFPNKDGGVASNFRSSWFEPFSPNIQYNTYFWGRSLPVSGPSIWPCLVTLQIHKLYGCKTGSFATPGHPHFELLRWLADFGSVSRACLSLRVIYIPGHINMGADLLSRQPVTHREWKLHPEVVKHN